MEAETSPAGGLATATEGGEAGGAIQRWDQWQVGAVGILRGTHTSHTGSVHIVLPPFMTIP